ncbi:hypothetical protein ACLQ8T_15345 [Glutamicibacter sp. FR1]|uniref:hypothetical protein n=1 Tax=Glutamicibacter sp. FR1 TaxID=3393744 RepID=UPI0039AEE2F6
MKKSLAVPVETSPQQGNAWSTRIQKIATFASEQCQSRDTVHSAICTITGSPEQLVINLACTAKSEDQVSELMQYVNDTLLPQMETALGVRFEVKNLQFAVAGKESLLAAPEHAPEAELPAHWLDQPFAAPKQTPTPGLGLEPASSGSQSDASPADLSMA